MRRSWLMLALVLLLAGMVQAVTLDVWLVGVTTEEQRILMDIMDREFTSKTGIDVDITIIAWGDYETKFLFAAASGETPDIGYMGAILAPQLGVRGALVDLAAEFGEEYALLESRTFPGIVDGWRYGKVAYGIPFGQYLYPSYYRTDIMKDMGIEYPFLTWDDMRRVLPRFQAQGMNATLAWGLGDAIYADASMFIWQHGGEWFTPDLLASAWDSPASMRGFKEYVELYTQHKIVTQPVRIQMFRDGYVPFMAGHVFDYQNLTYAAPELAGKWEVALVPGTQQPGGGLNHAAYSGPITFSIFKNSSHKAESWELIKWLVSSETQALYAKEIMERIPGRIFVPTDREAFALLPLPEKDIKVLLDQAEFSRTPPFSLAPREVSYRLIDFATHRVIQQGMTPEDAIRQAAQQMTQELRRKEAEFRRFVRN